MHVHYELTEGPGYYTRLRLTEPELASVRGMINRQYLDRLNEFAPNLIERAAAIGVDMYHSLPITFDHASSWTKSKRLLDAAHVAEFSKMEFFHEVEKHFGPSTISHDELNWRLVRPNIPGDVGPVHADKWFWDAGYDAGYGPGQMPDGLDRFKIWIPIHSEPGANGLMVKPKSHQFDGWKRHFEIKDGIRKPVLDERMEDLNMQLLPLEPGNMVLFHDSLLHGGAVNKGKKCRVSLELTILFQTAEAKQRMDEQPRGTGSQRAAA
jgi:hypothetical protein